MLQNSSDLYNGNIARMVTTITDPNSRAVLPLGNAYRYDQLNRLKHAVSFDQLNGNAWAGGAPAKYENSFTYDANGNILTQERWNDANQKIDQLQYNYKKNSAGKLLRNRLYSVDDIVVSTVFADDIDDMNFIPGNTIETANNYKYDQEGRLIQDLQEEIVSIEWRLDGKVKRINRIANSAKQNLSFDYDAMGHRIAKHVYTSANVLEKSTYYVLDAQGNTMATYERAVDENTQQISYAQTEKFIYGSSRLGVQNCNIALLGSQNNTYTQTTVPHRIGKKGYELSNHLGNVLSVISDKVIPHSNGSTVDYWQADILQSTDYSPFGVQLNNRTLSKSGVTDFVRFGFNSHENDDEIAGKGNHLSWGNFGMDPRLGRRWNIDPQAYRLPGQSPYNVNNNSPISVHDPDGEFGIFGAIIGAVAGAVADAGYQVYKGMKEGKGFGDAFSDIKWGEVGAAAAGGAVAGATMGLAAPLVSSMGGAAVISQAGVAYVYGGTAILSTLTGSMVKNAIKGRGKIDGQEVLYDVTYAIPDLLTGGLIDNVGGTFTKAAKKEAQETLKQGKKAMKAEITKDLRANGAGRRQANKLANKSIKKMEDMIDNGFFPKAINVKIGTEASKVTVSGIGSGVLEDYKQPEKK